MALRPPIYPKAPSHRSWQTTERKKQFCGTWTTDSPRLRKTIDISQNPVVTGMSAICQVSAATAGGDRTGASGHPAGSWLPCTAEVGRGYGRRRVEKGWKSVRTQRTQSSPGGPRQPMGAGPAEVWGEPFWPANAGIAAGRG